jgi:O-antigen/teichoic acid export membrane protein
MMSVKMLRGPVAGSFATSGAIQAMNVITGVVLARGLGVSGRGELAAILLWPGVFVTLGSLGVGDGIAYHTARRTAPVRAIVGTVAAFWAIQSAVVVAIGAALIPVLLNHYGRHATYVALIYLSYIPFFLAIAYVMSLLQGMRRFGAFQALRSSLIIATAAGLLLLAIFGRLSIGTAVAVYLGAYAVVCAAAFMLLSRVCRQRPVFDGGLARALFGFAVRSHTSNTASLFNERLDQLMISIFLAPVQLGLYVTAVTLTSLTSLVGQSVGMIALPVVAAEQPGAARAAKVRRYVCLTILGASALTLPLIVLTPKVIAVFFGDEFAPATTVTRVLLVAAVVLTTTRLVQSLLKAAGRPLDAGISEFVALGATVASLAILLPWLGILGAGIASLLAYSLSAAWTAHRAATALGLSSVRLLVFAPARGRMPDALSDVPRESVS